MFFCGLQLKHIVLNVKIDIKTNVFFEFKAESKSLPSLQRKKKKQGCFTFTEKNNYKFVSPKNIRDKLGMKKRHNHFLS